MPWPTEEGETNTVHYFERLVGSALQLDSEKQTGADGKLAADGVASTKTFSEQRHAETSLHRKRMRKREKVKKPKS